MLLGLHQVPLERALRSGRDPGLHGGEHALLHRLLGKCSHRAATMGNESNEANSVGNSSRARSALISIRYDACTFARSLCVSQRISSLSASSQRDSAGQQLVAAVLAGLNAT